LLSGLLPRTAGTPAQHAQHSTAPHRNLKITVS